MKRSILLSALVIGLVAFAPACGGGGTDGKTPEGGENKDGGGDSGKAPIDELSELSDGLQKSVDDLLKPINDAEAAIDAIGKLPGEIKASVKAGFKLDPKKLSAVAEKVVKGEDIDLAPLGFTEKEAEAKGKVEAAFKKLKDVVDGIKKIDENIKAIGEKLKEAGTKAPALVAKVVASAQVQLKNPFGSAEVKAKAQADMDKATKIKDTFMGKIGEWQKTITDLPAKAVAAKDKMAKAVTSIK